MRSVISNNTKTLIEPTETFSYSMIEVTDVLLELNSAAGLILYWENVYSDCRGCTRKQAVYKRRRAKSARQSLSQIESTSLQMTYRISGQIPTN